MSQLSLEFEFQDAAEQYYSAATIDRFYSVLSKQEQLTPLLLAPHARQQLQHLSKQYRNTVLATLGGSILLLYPLNKIRFGSGWTGAGVRIAGSCFILSVPTILANHHFKQKMDECKKKAYEQSRPGFRRYELTGDALQASSAVQIVEE